MLEELKNEKNEIYDKLTKKIYNKIT